LEERLVWMVLDEEDKRSFISKLATYLPTYHQMLESGKSVEEVLAKALEDGILEDEGELREAIATYRRLRQQQVDTPSDVMKKLIAVTGMAVPFGRGRPHQLTLYLDEPLYKRLVKYQADRGLGWTYAGLSVLVEGLHATNYLDDKNYEFYRDRYLKPLRDSAVEEAPQKVQGKAEAEEEAMRVRRDLRRAYEQFEELPMRSQLYWLHMAEAHPDIQEAKELLEKYRRRRSE